MWRFKEEGKEQGQEERNEKEGRGNSGRRRQARSWAEMHGDSDHLEEEQVVTASFLVTCRQVEGGNRMLEGRTHFFIAEVKLRPWEVLEASTPGVPTPGCQAVRGPWSHLDSKPHICFPTASLHDCCPHTPDEYRADNEDSETVSKNTEVIYFFFHIFQKFSLSLIHRLFLVILPHLLFPTFCD